GEGVQAELQLQIKPGTGKIFTSIEPLIGTSTQTTQKTAVNVARKYSDKVDSYDYFFTINSNVSEVTGPSAGAAMALLVSSLLLDKEFPSNVSVTGTITDEGYIGVVGGVYAKTKEASETGIDLFLIPKGEATQTVKLESGVSKINLIDYAPQELGIKVIEVASLDEALEYAFSDIEEIDANASVDEPLPEFVPESISIPEYLKPFKKITENELKKTELIISKAKTNLSNTRLNDASTLALLLEILDDAEQTFKKAQGLNESNYLYSAANYSFLAKINASVVSLVAENPLLLEENSTQLDELFSELNEEISLLEQDLNSNYPAEKFEWFVTAQQRLTYAKNYLARLTSTQTVVVGGSKYDVQSIEITRVQDYLFAKSWLEIAKAFYSESLDGKMISSVESFNNSMNPFIEEAETRIASKDKKEVEDIIRRIDSAKEQAMKEWYLGALFDAASAHGLSLNDSFTSTDSNELKSELSSRIDSLKKKINSSGKQFLWAELYLAHAEFFLKSGDFYLKNNLGGNAVDSYSSGLSIILLSEDMFFVSNQVQEFLEKNPSMVISKEELMAESLSQDLTESDPLSMENILNKPYSVLTLIISLVLFLSLVALLSEAFRFEKSEKKKVLNEIHHVKNLMHSLDESFAKGHVKEQQYKSKVSQYSNELIKLRNELDNLHGNSLKIEKNEKHEKEGLRHSFNVRLNALEKHYHEGLIEKDNYEKQKKEFQEKLDSLKPWSSKPNLDEIHQSNGFFSAKTIEKELNEEKNKNSNKK
ncbi:MAG: hypothetical protein JW703_04380, partial [Candidatus Diapherotrites archaeon]|nr:hypothetical protein [Candidatus Diapherotrites archaeon]